LLQAEKIKLVTIACSLNYSWLEICLNPLNRQRMRELLEPV
jgi:hypothetical protein